MYENAFHFTLSRITEGYSLAAQAPVPSAKRRGCFAKAMVRALRSPLSLIMAYQTATQNKIP
jgi:hypothetical protein